MNEKELIARLQARDETAFEELIRLYEKKVYALCVRMCGNAEDAEEAAQDTFLALWRGIDRFRQESALSTWIYRLTSNACIDLMRRRRKSEGSVSLDDEALFLDAADPRAPAAAGARAARSAAAFAGGTYVASCRIPQHFASAGGRGSELFRNFGDARAGTWHREIAHQPGANTFAQFFICQRELFRKVCVKSYRM